MKIRFLTHTRLQGYHRLCGSQCLQFAYLQTRTTPHTISEAATMITACLVVDDLRKDHYHYSLWTLSPNFSWLARQSNARKDTSYPHMHSTHGQYKPRWVKLPKATTTIPTDDYSLQNYPPHSEHVQQNWQKPRRTCTPSQTGHVPVYNDKCLHAIVPASRSTFHHLEPTQQNWQK